MLFFKGVCMSNRSKKTHILMIGLIGLSLSGCLVPQNEPTKAKVVTQELQCPNVTDLVLGKPQTNELNLDAREILTLAIHNINATCEILPPQSTIEVGYEDSLGSDVKEATFTAQETKTAKVTILFHLTSPTREQQSSGSATLQITDKKFLELGKVITISKEDKQILIKKAFEASWEELMKPFKEPKPESKTTQEAQETQQNGEAKE